MLRSVLLVVLCPAVALAGKEPTEAPWQEGTVIKVPAKLDLKGVRAPTIPYGQNFVREVEPNGTSGTATPLGGTNVVAQGNQYPAADEDFYSFQGTAGDRVYAATQTSYSAAGTDTILTLLGTDGTTVIEEDDQDGSFGASSSSIAGATLPATGTFFLRVRNFSATAHIRPYQLSVQVQSGAPVAETEPNDVTPQPLPASGWVSGDTSSATDVDFFSLSLNAGDTVYLSLDLDPERDATEWNGVLGLGIFDNFILVVNDAGAATPDSEAFFMTVRDAGTYVVRVAAATTFGTYHLSVSVHPPENQTCTTYTSTDVPQTVGPGVGQVASTLTVPSVPGARIGDLDVSIDLDVLAGQIPADLDVTLVAPGSGGGNEIGLFTDIGATTAAPTNAVSINFVLDEEAGVTPAFTVLDGMRYQPELNYRLSWFDGQDPAGTWTLRLNDDLANASAATLNNWSITVCEAPTTCSPSPTIYYSQDFEANDGGYTHSGTADEWAWGTPSGASAPVLGCNSGSSCWKTDLTGGYNASSIQDLVSVPINLTAVTGPVNLSWAMKYQIETTTFDDAWVEVRQVGGANPRRVWQWDGPTMTTGVGNPTVTVQESAGWALFNADISAYAGQNIEVVFHLNTDTSVQLSGIAIDDVRVDSCPVPVELTGFTIE